MLCYCPLVSELGGGTMHGAANPVIGGTCAPQLRRLCMTVHLFNPFLPYLLSHPVENVISVPYYSRPRHRIRSL